MLLLRASLQPSLFLLLDVPVSSSSRHWCLCPWEPPCPRCLCPGESSWGKSVIQDSTQVRREAWSRKEAGGRASVRGWDTDKNWRALKPEAEQRSGNCKKATAMTELSELTPLMSRGPVKSHDSRDRPRRSHVTQLCL